MEISNARENVTPCLYFAKKKCINCFGKHIFHNSQWRNFMMQVYYNVYKLFTVGDNINVDFLIKKRAVL